MDRGLLLGLQAMQSELITREQFFDAFRAWIGDRACSLDTFLIQHSVLSPIQLEWLSSELIAIERLRYEQWRLSIAESVATESIYREMRLLAEHDAEALQMVNVLAKAPNVPPAPMGLSSTQSKAQVSAVHSHESDDPHDTLQYENDYDPHSTLMEPPAEDRE